MAFIERADARLGRLLQHTGFMRYLSARLLASVAVQMQTVAVGWQVYAITGDHAPLPDTLRYRVVRSGPALNTRPFGARNMNG